MNIKQLERILKHIRSIEETIEEDNFGTYRISNVLTNLAAQVREELKGLVWKQYLDEH